MSEVHSVLARAGKVNLHPFPHIVIEDCLPEEYYNRLYETRPIVDMVGLGQNKRRDIKSKNLLKMDLTDQWRAFIRYHTSKAFWKEVYELFPLYEHYPEIYWKREEMSCSYRGGLGNLSMECQVGINSPPTVSSSVRGPHLDNPIELYGSLLYMRDPKDCSLGGNLQILKLKSHPKFYDKLQIDEEYVEVCATVPYKANTLVMFLGTNLSFHAVTPREPSEFIRNFVSIAGEMPHKLFKAQYMRYLC